MAVIAPDYTISELQAVGVVSTIQLSTDVTPCPIGISTYSTSSPINVEIVSLSIDGDVQYKPLADGDFSFVYTVTCEDESADSGNVSGSAEASIGTLTPIVSPQSGIINFPTCCVECVNPIIVSDLYEGDTYIPFSLDMADGTEVKDSLTLTNGVVFNGSGVVELTEALTVGDVVKLQVDSTTCKANSTSVTVKAKEEGCETCPPINKCHIRLLNVSVKHIGINQVAIATLNVEANGELKYKLDAGEWLSDWGTIGTFSSLVNHVLAIKLVNNPSCKIEYPFLAISYT